MSIGLPDRDATPRQRDAAAPHRDVATPPGDAGARQGAAVSSARRLLARLARRSTPTLYKLRLPTMPRALTGLRARLLAAMLLTSAVTLAVAALALLSPLEARLRADGMHTTRVALAASLPEIREIAPRADGGPNRTQLRSAGVLLARRASADVAVLDAKLNTIYAPMVSDLNVPDYFAEATRVLTHGGQVDHTSAGSLIVAQRVRIAHHHYALIVVKHLQFVGLAVKVVRSAFLVAAAVSLVIALLLGASLARTILLRLHRLREASVRLEQEGPQAPPLPLDGRRDEIGELTRAFAGMQERLRRQDAARRAFVATASHELRTPLASLHGMLELLAEDLDVSRPDLDDARIRTEDARQQTRRLSQLAADLLDLSRLDSDVTLRSEPLELDELARAVASEFELAAERRSVAIVVRDPAGPCWAAADPGSVARIVRILIDNALRFAPAESRIEIAASGSGARTRILVSDEGPGVPQPDRERIFERFVRGPATAGHAGFGLGLAIGRELAVRMGGELLLVDERAGAGACFELSLPAANLGEEQA